MVRILTVSPTALLFGFSIVAAFFVGACYGWTYGLEYFLPHKS